MPVFSNRAIQVSPYVIDLAKSTLCYSERARSWQGEVCLCSLAEGTIRGYACVMKRYKVHCEARGIPMYPPTEELWTEVMSFIPSQSREQIVRAKSAWLLYGKLNEVEIPAFVGNFFDGLKRIKVPVKRASKPCRLIPHDQFVLTIMTLASRAASSRDHLVIVSLLTAAFAGFRLGDSVRLLKSSFTRMREGYKVTHNTKKNCKTGMSHHDGYIPFSLDNTTLNYGLVLEVSLAALNHLPSEFLFVTRNGAIEKTAAIRNHAYSFFKKSNLPYISTQALRATLATTLLKSMKPEWVDLAMGWSRGKQAAAFYIQTSSEFRFREARKL